MSLGTVLGTTGTQTLKLTTSWQIPRSTCLIGRESNSGRIRGGSTAPPRWGTPTLLGCSISFTTCLRGELPGSCWPTGPCLLTLREKGKFGRTSWKLTWWIASSHSPDSYSDRPRYRPASGFCAEDDRNRGARPGSSMSAGWATSSTEAGDYADIPGFWRKSRSTDTSSHPDVMLGQRLRRTTGNLLRRRWLCSLPSGGNSRQRRSSWTPRFSPPGVVGVGDAP